MRYGYSQSQPAMGWMAEERRYGIYRSNVEAATYPSVQVRSVSPEEVPDLLADVREYFANSPRPVRITIEDRETDRILGPPLLAAGLTLDERTSYLAHVGDISDAREVSDLRIDTIGEDGLEEYETTRVKGFTDSEDPIAPEDLGWRIDLRRAEMKGGSVCWLARINEEPAASMSWYAGEDRLIHSLATRVPFRSHGLAWNLLCMLLADSRATGTRAVIISADEADTPIQLYRRLGFTDEVYWRATYELELAP